MGARMAPLPRGSGACDRKDKTMTPLIMKPMEDHTTLPAASPPPADKPDTALLPIMVGLTALFGYGALLLSGFGDHLGAWRPVPLYLFLGYLLIWFQSSLDIRRSAWHIVNILLVTGFALAFAADAAFHTGKGWHFTQDPRTYMAINGVLFLVYLVEMVRTRFGIGTTRPTPSSTKATSTLAAFATDFGGLALLAFTCALVAAMLQWGSTPYVSLDIHKALGITLPSQIQNLQQLNFAIGLGAVALALLAFGLVSGEAALEGGGDPQATPAARMGASLRNILATAGDEMTFTIRWAFGPLIWLLTTFSLAYLAKLITDYLNIASTSTRVVDLFNPFSVTSQGRYWEALLSIELMVVAAGMTIVCIALIEHRMDTIERALQILRQSGQIIILSFAFFTFSLAAINALVVFVGITRVEPFQVSGMTLLAIILSGIFTLDARRRARQRVRQQA
jgi:hypothetical protein